MPEPLNPSPRPPYAWTEIFRCFQVALDPRKLLVAAVGILAMSVGWNLLSSIFYYSAPDAKAPQYDIKTIAKSYEGKKKADNVEYTDADFTLEASNLYQRDFAQWYTLADLAGPGGTLRTLPWNEDRGENPYKFVSRLASQPASAWTASILTYFSRQVPNMVEPLTKLMLPVIKLADENASTTTRIYLILCIFWSVAVWAVAGGIITRIAAVQLSGKDRVSIFDAAEFVKNRFLSYLLSPVVPLGIIGGITLGTMILGLLALIPIVGDLLYIIIVPLVILGGIIMTVLVLGLVGYPLMYGTLSSEGSDTFDALSRTYNYVFQAPWTYAWNCIVAVAYGAIVTFFVIFVASLMVYLGKWALIRTPLAESTNQRADYLFAYAPQSFGWQELLLRGSPIEKKVEPEVRPDGRVIISHVDANPAAAEQYMKSYRWWNWIGTAATTVTLTIVFLLMLGFSYSFFWSAATMIYLLMRQTVDDVDLDEVYLEDDTPLAPAAPAAATATGPASTPLPQVTPPVSPPAPVAAPVPPATPAPVPVVPPATTPSSGTSIETPKLDEKK
jgi:hypothetical protein